MRVQNRLAKVMLVAALVLAASVGFAWSVRHANAGAPPDPDRLNFGMLGITRGQTVRLNVVNVDASSGPSQRVLLNFRDADGNLLRNREGQPIHKVADLHPGESTFLNFNVDDVQLPPGPTRLQLRPVVTVQLEPDANIQLPSGVIIPTAEVINDANDRTAFVISALPAVQRASVAPSGE